MRVRERLSTATLERDRFPDWREKAACGSYDPELFFGLSQTDVDAAKSICHGECEVRGACLRQALADGELYGVFGGLDAAERRGLLSASFGRCRVGARAGRPCSLPAGHDGRHSASGVPR